MVVRQIQLCWLNHRNRGQAPSHIGMPLARRMYSLQLWEGLAPDGGVPDAAVLAEPLQSGASPLPHWNVTGLTDVLASTVGGGKPFPHWNDTGPTDVLASTVGGGLPPMGVCQTQLPWLTPCNRGQAPTLECHWPDGCTRFNCGRGLAPDGGLPDPAVLADPLQSGAAPSHIGIVFVSGEWICPNLLIVAL